MGGELRNLLLYLAQLQQEQKPPRKPWADRVPAKGDPFDQIVANYIAQQATSGAQSAGGDVQIGGYYDPSNTDFLGYQSTPPVIGFQAPWDGDWSRTPPADFSTGTYQDQFTGGTVPDRTNESLVSELLTYLGLPFANANTSVSTSIGADTGITGMDPKYPGDTYMPTGGGAVGGGRAGYNGFGMLQHAGRDETSATGADASIGDGQQWWDGPLWPGRIYSDHPKGVTPDDTAIGGGGAPNYLSHLALALINAERMRGQGSTSPGPGLAIQHSAGVSGLFQNPFGGSQRIPEAAIPVRPTIVPTPVAPPSRYGSGFPGQAATAPSMVGLFGNSQASQPVGGRVLNRRPVGGIF